MKKINKFAPGINKSSWYSHKRVYDMDEGGYYLYQGMLIGSSFGGKMFVINKSGKTIFFHEGLTSTEWNMLYV